MSGREDVVFGTVLFGRMQGGEGADRVLGLFINTLPVRIRVGEEGVEAACGARTRCWPSCCGTSTRRWRWRSAAAAVAAPAPLFTALLNYRQQQAGQGRRSEEEARAREGVREFYGQERTNYPVTLSVTTWARGCC